MALPSTVSIVAAANPVEIAAGGEDLAAPLANRFVHLQWSADLAQWQKGFLTGWTSQPSPLVVPADTLEAEGRWRGIIAGFLSARPDLFRKLPEGVGERGGAWPSPRTWDLCHRVLGAAEAAEAGLDVQLALAVGCVGPGVGIELLNYSMSIDLPDPESLLAEADSCLLPQRNDQLLAVLASVVSAIAAKPSQARWHAGWRIMGRVVDEGQPDVAAAVTDGLIDLRERDWTVPEVVQVFLPLLEQAGLLGD